MGIKHQKFKTIPIDFQIKSNLMDIYSVYKDDLSKTFELLKDSKNDLKFKSGNRIIDRRTYKIRLVNLHNMAMIYYYALYEGFTRMIFKTIKVYESDISHKEFEELYPTLYKIIVELMKKKYKIYIPYRIFKVIKLLHDTRNNITHHSCNATTNFENIELCTEKIQDYFDLIIKKFRFVNF